MQQISRKMILTGVSLTLSAVFIFVYTAGINSRSAAVAGRRVQAVEAAADTSEKLPPSPSVLAQSAVLIEGASGRVLYELKKDEQLYPASTTKIMTALLAVERAEDEELPETPESETEEYLKKKVKVPDEAVGAEGSSIYLKKGEMISLEDLLYGMMLRSGNDAALAVAALTGGSVEDFTDMMNERAEALGMKNTHFCNPNGLQDEEHYSSAYDLAMLSREAMKHEIFRQIAGAKVWNASREGADSYNYFYNKNKTIFQYEGATGIKIGYTTAAGRCLVASAKKNGMELIAVVLNDPNWFEDAYALFDYGFARYNNVTVCEAEKTLTRLKVENTSNNGSNVLNSGFNNRSAASGGKSDTSILKKTVRIGVRDAVICPSHKGEKTDISIEYVLPEKAAVPVSRWEQAGEMKIYSGGEYIYSVPLYYLEDIG